MDSKTPENKQQQLFWEPSKTVNLPPSESNVAADDNSPDIPEKDWHKVFDRANAELRKAIEEDEARMKTGGENNGKA